MAMLTRWEPFRELARVQEGMRRVFGDERELFRAGESVGWAPARTSTRTPKADVVQFELAGVEPKDVSSNSRTACSP